MHKQHTLATPLTPRRSPEATTALVLGALSVFFPIILPLPAIAVGWRAIRTAAETSDDASRRTARIGLILGWATLIFYGAAILILLTASQGGSLVSPTN